MFENAIGAHQPQICLVGGQGGEFAATPLGGGLVEAVQDHRVAT